jgi:uncharacterized protein
MDDNKLHYISVTGIIRNKEGKYLICKRSENEKAFPGKWCVPGGKLEKNDFINNPKDTSDHWLNVFEKVLDREIFEETKVKIKNIGYVSNLAFIRPNGFSTVIISLFGEHESGDVILDKEALVDYAWVDLEEVKNYDLIENIYEQIKKVDNYFKDGEVKKENIIKKVREFVEEECKKPTSKYGYEPYEGHFIPVVKYSKILGERLNADLEILEIAAWLHDIGSIINGRENHHITGSEIAERKLTELNYPAEKIKQVKHCILTHRGSQDIIRETIEAQILADADSMSHFDNIVGPLKAALVYEGLDQFEANNSVKNKLIRSYNKLSKEAKHIIKPKYDAAMLLLGGENGIYT